MRKFITRLTFMLTFLGLGTAFGIAAHGQTPGDIIDPAPRAIQCSAAFELMSRAAPQWATQPDVIKARLDWAEYVNRLTEVTGTDAHEQVENEMLLLADSLTQKPSELSRLAVQCVADAPDPKVSGNS